MNLKVCIKSCTCYYSNDIIKNKNFGFGNILLDEISHKNFLIFKVLLKNFGHYAR